MRLWPRPTTPVSKRGSRSRQARWRFPNCMPTDGCSISTSAAVRRTWPSEKAERWCGPARSLSARGTCNWFREPIELPSCPNMPTAFWRVLGIARGPGDRLDAAEVDAILDFYVHLLEGAVNGTQSAFADPIVRLHQQVAFEIPAEVKKPIVTLSGGVGELLYRALRARRCRRRHSLATWGSILRSGCRPRPGGRTVPGNFDPPARDARWFTDCCCTRRRLRAARCFCPTLRSCRWPTCRFSAASNPNRQRGKFEIFCNWLPGARTAVACKSKRPAVAPRRWPRWEKKSRRPWSRSVFPASGPWCSWRRRIRQGSGAVRVTLGCDPAQTFGAG